MKTLLCTMLFLSVASVTRAQPIVGETWQQTITRRQIEDQLDRQRREQGAENWRLHMDHQGQDDRLDDLRRRMDALPDNTGGR